MTIKAQQKNQPNNPNKQNPEKGAPGHKGGQQGGPGKSRENQDTERDRKFPGQGQENNQEQGKGNKKTPNPTR